MLKTFHISTTRLCNLNCIYCCEGVRTRGVLDHDIVAGKTGGVIPKKEIYANIKIGSKDYTSIVFSSGEPTLNSELPDFIAYAKQSGFSRIELVTNGIKISNLEYLNRLLGSGLTHLVISVNSFHPEICKIVSQNNYNGKKTSIAIQNALSVGLQLVVNIVITRYTLLTLNHTLQVLSKIGVRQVTISFLRYDGFMERWDGYDRIKPNKVSYEDLINYSQKYKLGEICKKFYTCNFNDVPICVLQQMGVSDSSFEYSKSLIHVNGKGNITEQKNVGVRRVFLDACDECLLKKQCCGVEERYVKIFSGDVVDQELSPNKDVD